MARLERLYFSAPTFFIVGGLGTLGGALLGLSWLSSALYVAGPAALFALEVRPDTTKSDKDLQP